MPNSITAAGLTVATQQELIDFYTSAYQSIYGADINLESDTPDGQMMNITIQVILDIQDLLVQVYNMFDPDNAIGIILDQRVAINGIQRQAGTFTTTNVTVVTNRALNLAGLDQDDDPVFTVADGEGNQWQLITSQVGVAPGTHVYLFQSSVPGQILTVPNSIIVPVTIVLGVDSVNNPTTYATLGINEESDFTLKLRRQKSVSLQSQGYYQGLLAALENINGVQSAFIYENTTDGPDGDGIPGHSIWVIISGTPTNPLTTAYNAVTVYQYGDLASSAGVNYISVQNNNVGNSILDTTYWAIYNPVAEAIYNYRNAGCGMFQSGEPGAQQYTITQIDGTFITMYWDLVVQEDLYTKFTVNSLNGTNPPNVSAILSYLVSNFIPGVYEEVNINGLSTLVQQADPNTLVTNSGFATSVGGAYTETKQPTTKNRQFTVSAGNIIILPIILSCPGGVQVIVGGLVTNTAVRAVSGGATIQFTPLGGRAAYSYAVISGTGSVNGAGLYTTSAAGVDVVQVTDGLGNLAIATVTVS